MGKPPFETSSLEDTYSRIQNNKYTIPLTKISAPAVSLIRRLLQNQPTSRPNMVEILRHDFIVQGRMSPPRRQAPAPTITPTSPYPSLNLTFTPIRLHAQRTSNQLPDHGSQTRHVEGEARSFGDGQEAPAPNIKRGRYVRYSSTKTHPIVLISPN